MRLRQILPLVAVGSGLALMTAGSAAAATYCVHLAGSCAAGTIDSGIDLQAAITAAQGTLAADVVTIGPGTYTAPANGFAVVTSNPLSIVGSGDTTILDGPGQTIISTGGWNLSSVAVHPGVGNSTGIAAAGGGTVDHVTVTGPGTGPGINLAGSVTLRDSTVTMTSQGIFASVFNGAAPVILDTTVDAPTAVNAVGAGSLLPFVIRRLAGHSRIAVHASQSVVRVENSVLHHLPGGSEALLAECNANGSGSLTADHVTILGTGAPTGAMQAYCGEAGLTASLSLTNSTIRDIPTSTSRGATNGGTANISIAYSDLKPTNNGDSGPGAITFGAGVVNLADPGFVSATDAHLVLGSGLIDAGAPGAALSDTDLDGLPRISGARQDIGAYEYQYPYVAPPVVAPPAVTDGPAPNAGVVPPAPAPSGGPAAPAHALPLPPAGPTAARVRAGLRSAIRSGRSGRPAYRWLTAGTVRFDWYVGGRLVGHGSGHRSTPGSGHVRIHLNRRLRAGTRVTVRARFTPAVGRVVHADARISREGG